MHHETPSATGSADVDGIVLLVRLFLLLGSALLAGFGLWRPLVGSMSGGARRALYVGSWAVAVLALVSIPLVDAQVLVAGAHAVLALAIPLVSRWPSLARWLSAALLVLVVVETALGRSGVEFAADTVYVVSAACWFGVTIVTWLVPADDGHRATLRPVPIALTLGMLLLAAGVIQLLLSGLAFDRRLFATVAGWAVLTVVLAPGLALAVIAVHARHTADSTSLVFRRAVPAVLIGFLAWTTFAAMPPPAPLPVAGVPVLANAELDERSVPVLISPHRPGRNLVHLPTGSGTSVSVEDAEGGRVEVTRRPGAQGWWAEVDLPAGRSSLVLHTDSTDATVEVDTGQAAGLPTAAGVDGPECAMAALGGVLDDGALELDECPADRLAQTDVVALRQLVDFLAARDVTAIRLDTDDSARGAAAAARVRAAAARHGLRLTDRVEPDAALVVVSGWESAFEVLREASAAQREEPAYTHGVYLAPWLLHGPIVKQVVGAGVPLSFDPREPMAVQYTVEVASAFASSPSPAGFQRWLAARQQYVRDDVRIFSTAQVNVMPMNPGEPHAPGMPMSGGGAGLWISGGTVVPVTAPLEP
ncbi:hypothetical protein [Tamaricihabitans halophyticus]|nr:hypothetical protein [Tamaricihabitans halophyticus]